MTDNIKQKIENELKELPKEFQDVVNNSNWINISEEIGKTYLITDEEINNLQIEIGLVLICSEQPEFFVGNLEDNIPLPKGEAEKIAKVVFEKILGPIGEKLTQIQKERIKTKEPDWKQNINFFLNGGDYGAFIEHKGTTNKEDKPKTILIENSSRIEDLKNSFTI